MGNHNGFYILFVTFSLLATLGSSLGRFGFDTSLQVLRGATYSDFQCLRHHNYTFAVLQAFDGDNGYNWDIDKCTNWAWNAGFYNVDVYIFMCPNCRGNNPPESAIQQIINNLRSQNVKFGLLWLDVEYCDGCWNDRSSNAKFLSKAVSQVISMGNKVGIYSSKNDWENVLGNNTAFSTFPLWYANWNRKYESFLGQVVRMKCHPNEMYFSGIPNFNDGLYRFGGWTWPTMKQYYDHGPCIEVNVDW
jgi:GH25 family lysozyme M1 (1,4-beta-N-acetylmuramidase)